MERVRDFIFGGWWNALSLSHAILSCMKNVVKQPRTWGTAVDAQISDILLVVSRVDQPHPNVKIASANVS